ncbi:transposase [Roseovarius aestuariivivens]|uniref:transposase n=1 Tax=Roseovarius aestuariivivens TaxID=1888910 RepID=UPI0014368CD0
MARKRYSDEDILKLLREIELKLAEGGDVQSACRAVGVSDVTYYNWRRRFHPSYHYLSLIPPRAVRYCAHPPLSHTNPYSHRTPRQTPTTSD